MSGFERMKWTRMWELYYEWNVCAHCQKPLKVGLHLITEQWKFCDYKCLDGFIDGDWKKAEPDWENRSQGLYGDEDFFEPLNLYCFPIHMTEEYIEKQNSWRQFDYPAFIGGNQVGSVKGEEGWPYSWFMVKRNVS